MSHVLSYNYHSSPKLRDAIMPPISSAPHSWSAPEDANQDTNAPAPSIPTFTTHTSDANENELQESVQTQDKGTKRVNKGKGRDQKKHGVMSLPAEIRETYAFQSSASTLKLFCLSSRLLN